MNRVIRVAVGFSTTLVSVTAVHAQVPAIPAVPSASTAATTAAAAGTAAPAAAPAGGNLWSFFMKTPAQKAQCQACFCASPLGKLTNGFLQPVSLATGGLIGPVCPNPATAVNPDDLKKPVTDSTGAAAKIKAQEAQAAAKIASLQYLATVDCRYYPEAEVALITALRAEKNECVRLEAAKSLARGCCCSTKVVKALTVCLNGSTADGAPAERSEPVLCYAYIALQRCLQTCVVGEAEPPPEVPPAKGGDVEQAGLTRRELTLIGFYDKVETLPAGPIHADARRALARGLSISPDTIARLTERHTLWDAAFPHTPTAPPKPAPTPGATAPVPVAATAPAPTPPAATPAAPSGRRDLLSIWNDARRGDR